MKNDEDRAKDKTISDYALILEHCNGYSKQESVRMAKESEGEELFEALLERNASFISELRGEKGELERARELLELAEMELTAMYKKGGYLGSNILTELHNFLNPNQ